MAKQAILDVLEKTIGKYVKNLDAESLNVAVWKGKIELHSLELNLDAINAELARQAAESPNLAIPFRVIDGSFGNLHVDVPWTRITSRSVVLRAKTLKVVVEPFDMLSMTDQLEDRDMSDKKRLQKIQDQRTESINASDEYRVQANALRKLAKEELPMGEDAKSSAEQASFTQNLVRRIIENIQVDVEDVHIALKGEGSAAGVVLESFSLATTNKDGERKFVDRKVDGKNLDDMFLYKVLQINGLGLYLDELMSSAKPTDVLEFSEILQHSYILSPLSFEAKLRQAASIKCSADLPKYLLRSELAQMSILLSKVQLELGNKIALAVSPSKNVARPLFPQYRPMSRITKESAKEWWIYAFRCVGRLDGRRLWPEFFNAFKKRKLYIPLYKRAAHFETCPWLQPLSTEEKAQLDAIELDRAISVEGIMAWRNIADAQAEREQQKHDDDRRKNADKKAGFLSSFFGSSKESSESSSGGEDSPPITLSVEEMQELEALTLEQTAEAELSNDSKLCDIQFALGSFKVNLVGNALKQLAAFEMSTATTSFDANADGSYAFSSSLATLEIHDSVTVNSLFPTVMRNIASVDEASDTVDEGVFKFCLEKSRTGDQNITLKLAAFEMVASQMLILDVKQFFTLSSAPPIQKHTLKNPMLTQSRSGAVDLFYDAEPGVDSSDLFDISEGAAAAKGKISDTLSLALIDAWKSKTKEKTKWTVDCDIHAPLLIIPESCSNIEAHVLVFDFGRLKFDYGKNGVEPKVKSWFDDQPKPSQDEGVIDPGSLGISDLTFTIGRAGDFHWRQPTRTASDLADNVAKSTVIEPLSASLHFGIQSYTTRDEPSVCAHGLVPVVSLSISPSQISKALDVYLGWTPVLSEFTKDSSGNTNSRQPDVPPENLEEGIDDDGEGSTKGSTKLESSPVRRLSSRSRRSSYSSPDAVVKSARRPTTDVHGIFTTMHISIGLQRLSIRVLFDSGEGVEAHLVSASASTSHKSDGSASNRLCMGWFWVLDRFNYQFPRRQRLVVHSTLPRPAASFAEEGKYDILDALRQQGVFEKDYVSSDLADVTLKSRGVGKATLSDKNPFVSKDSFDENIDPDTFLNAKFSSLHVHWNPLAVKVVMQEFGRTIALLKDSYGSTFDAVQTMPRRASSEYPAIQAGTLPGKASSGVSAQRIEEVPGPTRARTTMLVKAELQNLEITLDSAEDDEALFVVTMSSTRIEMLSSQFKQESSTLVSMGLGDLRIRTPETSRTLPNYRTMLGLAPDHSTSLLSVNYYMGTEAVRSSGLTSVDPSKCDMCGEITLSPMRLVCIKAQVMTLMEYVTEDILGALTARAASAAAEAALEVTQSAKAEQFYAIKATGFTIILPVSASDADHVAVEAGILLVEYRGLTGSASSEAHVSLSEVSMKDRCDQQMLNAPLQMVIDVASPPRNMGTMDDQAMRITINVSELAFLLTHNQYLRMIRLLERNFGEADPYLRSSADPLEDDNSPRDNDALLDVQESTKAVEKDSSSSRSSEHIAHAGEVPVVSKNDQNRMYIYFLLDGLSLELCDVDVSDPIVNFAAVKAGLAMRLVPDEESMSVEATLHNLTCDDRRLQTIDRPFRSLLNQAGEADEGANSNDVFFASYKKIGETSTEVDLKLGSPRIVFIPDVVADVVKFLETDQKPANGTLEPTETQVEHPDEQRVDKNNDSGEGVLAPLIQGSDSKNVTNMSLSFTTANCSIVLIDSGALTEPPVAGATRSLATSRAQVTETIVLQGQFDAKTSIASDIQSGSLVSASAELHGVCMEVYTAYGSNFACPIQIIEPASVSTFFTLNSDVENNKELDVRFVALSPLDITFSMQNAALMNAILFSCTDCFDTAEIDKVHDAPVPLSDEEASRIEALASALEAPSAVKGDNRSASQDQVALDVSSVSIQGESVKSEVMDSMSIISRLQVTVTEIKITIVNDLQGLDEGLFRINASNFVARGKVQQGDAASTGLLRQTTFDFQVDTSLMADYFDPSVHLWEILLNIPWEVAMKCSRDPGSSSVLDGMSTVLDIEAYPCSISFSEQFVVSLAASNKMWSIYSMAMAKAVGGDKTIGLNENEGGFATSKKALAASAARQLITSLPYAVDNHSGVDVAFLLPVSGERHSCPSGTMQYFRFEPPQGTGSGGRRRYGQDATHLKSIRLFACGATIDVEHIDADVGQARHARDLGEGRYLVTSTVKEGKTTVLHLSSLVGVHNCSSVPFHVSVTVESKDHNLGVCAGHQGDTSNLAASKATFDMMGGKISKASRLFGIPLDLLVDENITRGLHLSPGTGGTLSGEVEIPSFREVNMHNDGDQAVKRCIVSCKSPRESHEKKENSRPADPFVLQVRFKMSIIDNKHPFIEIFLEPRIVLENKMPIRLTVRTPMPHTFKGEDRSETREAVDNEGQEVQHELAPRELVEVFTPGPSIALSVKCSDPPVGGGMTDWMEGGWIDVPLIPEFGLPEPLTCVFPFAQRSITDEPNAGEVGGSEFFIVESGTDMDKYLLPAEEARAHGETSAAEESSGVEIVTQNAVRKVLLTVCNYAVDHTGDILFETCKSDGRGRKNEAPGSSVGAPVPSPFSAFSSLHRRITLLPHGKASLRFLHQTMEGDEGVRRSQPFCLNDISISEGGVDSTPIKWEDNSESGYFAYRVLVDTYQYQVDFIPEFIVFNGSKEHQMLIKQQDDSRKLIGPGEALPIRSMPQLGLVVSIEFTDFEGRASATRVDSLGLRVAMVKSPDGSPLGSLAVETVIGNRDSRLVVKLGEVKFGSSPESNCAGGPESQGMFDGDAMRFRMRWTELRVTLSEVRSFDTESAAFVEPPLDHPVSSSSSSFGVERKAPRQQTWIEARSQHFEEQIEIERQTQHPVCTIILQKFTVDWQRAFTSEESTRNEQGNVVLSSERSQFSAIIHNVLVLDETPSSEYPVVFDSTSATSFFDLCIRFRGPLTSELANIDLFDLNLAHADGKSQKIVIQTSEDFLWRAVDVASRIVLSTAQLAGIDLRLEWDKQDGGYIVSVMEISKQDFDTESSYTPPRSDRLYDISKARVSPFEMEVSFTRQPHASRYKKLTGGLFAKLMNYFMYRLKFKIDRADLRFGPYEVLNVKGPPDRLIEWLLGVYTSRMKFKVVSVLTAFRIQDWKSLCFIDGDSQGCC